LFSFKMHKIPTAPPRMKTIPGTEATLLSFSKLARRHKQDYQPQCAET